MPAASETPKNPCQEAMAGHPARKISEAGMTRKRIFCLVAGTVRRHHDDRRRDAGNAAC